MRKRKIEIVLCAVSLILGMWTVPVYAQEDVDGPDNLYARSAVLVDADSGRVLFGKNEQDIMPMASTTKIMTCILALEKMEEGQTGKASKNAALQPKVRMGVKEGETYYLKDLLYALMLESYNDSAVIIAEALSGTVEAFTKEMDRKAEKIGCSHTHFVTPNGLDGEDEKGIHSTTAEDLAMIMRYCITESPERERFIEITRTKNYQFTDVSGDRSYVCDNHNAFLEMMEGALTGKTGFTADAGYCYVGALKRDERTFIVSLLACGWPDHKDYKWKDTRRLMEYGLENYSYQTVNLQDISGKVKVLHGFDRQHPYSDSCNIPTRDAKHEDTVCVLMKKGEAMKVEKDVVSSVEAPVQEGAVVGKLRYLLDDVVVYECDMVTEEEACKKNYRHCLGIVTEALSL